MKNTKWLGRVRRSTRGAELSLIADGSKFRSLERDAKAKHMAAIVAAAAFHAEVQARIKDWNARIAKTGGMDKDIIALAHSLDWLVQFPNTPVGSVSASSLEYARQIMREFRG